MAPLHEYLVHAVQASAVLTVNHVVQVGLSLRNTKNTLKWSQACVGAVRTGLELMEGAAGGMGSKLRGWAENPRSHGID